MSHKTYDLNQTFIIINVFLGGTKMTTITITNTKNTIAIANLINTLNDNEWNGKIAIGDALNEFKAHKNYEVEGFKSFRKWMLAQCENGIFRITEGQLTLYMRVAEFLNGNSISKIEWMKLNFTCARILMETIKYCEDLNLFVECYANELAVLPQKKIREFANLVKEGMHPLDAYKAVTSTKIEGSDLNQKEDDDETVGSAEDMSEHIDIKANLQKILAMMKAKEYADAEASLEAMIEAL